MKNQTEITSEQITDLIVNEVFIRGIELEYYKNQFGDVSDKILQLIKGKTVSYYSSNENKSIELKP
jgi:hypothetical protein